MMCINCYNYLFRQEHNLYIFFSNYVINCFILLCSFQVQDLAVNNSIRPSEITAALLAHHEQELSSIVTEIKNAANTLTSEKEQEKIGGRIDKLLHKISLTDKNYQAPQNFAQHLEKKVDNLLDILTSSQRYFFLQ